jgi:hypothetical protein
VTEFCQNARIPRGKAAVSLGPPGDNRHPFRENRIFFDFNELRRPSETHVLEVWRTATRDMPELRFVVPSQQFNAEAFPAQSTPPPSHSVTKRFSIHLDHDSREAFPCRAESRDRRKSREMPENLRTAIPSEDFQAPAL